MSYKSGRITYGTTGSKTITTTFQPNEVELVVIPGSGTQFSDVRLSMGATDGTNQDCDVIGVYAGDRFVERFTDRLASIWEYNGSTWSEVVKITFTSWSATSVVLNVVTASSTYQVKYKIRG